MRRISTGVALARGANRALTGAIIDLADAAGIRITTPRNEGQRGGSVMLQLEDAAARVDELRGQGIYADARGTILRLSPGAITTMEHVGRLFDALRK